MMRPEIELKFYPVDKAHIRAKLTALSCTLVHPEILMIRSTFHHPALPDRWGRIRREASGWTMSIKKVSSSTLSGMFEASVPLTDCAQGQEFMEAAGFIQQSVQENYRETWRSDDIELTIDTWPGLEPCIELEGSSEASVKAMAEKLGFDLTRALYGSADDLYEFVFPGRGIAICRQPELTFDHPPA
jgi:adenylate cyclase class IV